MRRWVGMGLLVVACRNEGGFGSSLKDWGPPNPQHVETPIQIDRIAQTTIPSVDVLFVVDNLCSMFEEQQSLATNFPAVLAWFLGSGLDYHIGVVTTDMNDPEQAGRLRNVGGLRWIQEDTDQPEALFGQMA